MATDWFDGRIARSRGRSSPLGSLLDPAADKILVLAVLIMLVDQGVAPGWIVALIVVREFLVTALRLAALERGVVLQARDLGKLKTWSQALAAAIGGFAAAGAWRDDFAYWALLVALVLTWISGLDYARVAPRLWRGGAPASVLLGERLEDRLALLVTWFGRDLDGHSPALKPSGRSPIGRGMRRRFLPHVCMLVTLLAWSSDAAARPATSWAQAELRAVVAAGLMAKETAAHPQDPLTRGELETIDAGLLHTVPATRSASTATVTMTGLDASLVNTLGLTETAELFTQNAKTAGLTPPSRFGTEAVARLLGLRTNHPAALDSIELSPGEPATHAEAAYSAARILKVREWDVASAEEAAQTVVL